jgi:hypothetical protein
MLMKCIGYTRVMCNSVHTDNTFWGISQEVWYNILFEKQGGQLKRVQARHNIGKQYGNQSDIIVQINGKCTANSLWY